MQSIIRGRSLVKKRKGYCIMALTREDLQKLGVEGDAVEKIMSEYGKVRNDLTDLQKQDADQKGQVETLTAQVKERDDKISSLGDEAGASQKLKDQISQLQSDLKTKDNEFSAKLSASQKASAINLALIQAGVHDPSDVLSQIDSDVVKVDGNTLLGLNDQVTALKEKKPYLFKEADPVDDGNKPKGHVVTGQPKGGPAPAKTLAEMTMEEQNELYKRDPDAWEKMSY